MKIIEKIFIILSLLLIGIISFQAIPANADTNSQLCFTFNTNLGRGAFNQDVSNLQIVLIRENLLHITAPTSYFGNLTFGAVVNFQAKYGILQTGFVGPITRGKLSTLYGCGGLNQSPIINGISGPTVLNLNQTGTWTIEAKDPENGTLSYWVIWGDEAVYTPMTNQNNITYNQTVTLSHSYSSAGIHTPTFYVKDIAGNVVNSSISINVINPNINQPTINYMQPTSGKIGTRVTMVGSNFLPTGNKIKFGNLGVENSHDYNLDSINENTIVFTVPYSNYMSCWDGTPRCMTPAYLTQPGNYEVSVINNNGISNQMSFTVIQ